MRDVRDIEIVVPEFDLLVLGDIVLDTDKPDRLLVPSLKNLLDDPGAIQDLTLLGNVDHFKCYKVKVTEDTPKFVPQQVMVADQFDQTVLDVQKPERLCNPVNKDGEGIVNEIGHLLCYKVKRAEDEPKFVKIEGIHVNNQFGPLRLDAKKEKELCVPLEKDISGATPLDNDD